MRLTKMLVLAYVVQAEGKTVGRVCVMRYTICLRGRLCSPARKPPRYERWYAMQVQVLQLSVLFIKDQHSTWVAQCLEFDIAAQGKSFKDAQRAFERTFMGQIALDMRNDRRPLEGIKQAPKQYWSMYEESERLADRRPFRLPEGIPPAFMISAAQESRVWGY